MNEIIRLRYGNTNTFFVKSGTGGLLVDTDCAGTLPLFFRAAKAAGIRIEEITAVMATHWHPDHSGLIGDILDMNPGTSLLVTDTQTDHIRYPEEIFSRDRRIPFKPVDESRITVISADTSGKALSEIGINGEMIYTPSHSPDSVSLLLDSGDCIVGDLEPFSYIGGYENNDRLKRDWDEIMRRRPKRILFAHANEKILSAGDYDFS